MRPDRLSPRVNPVREWLDGLPGNPLLSPEERAFLDTQGRLLLRELHGASASELLRLAGALQDLADSRDESLTRAERSTARDRYERILAKLSLSRRRHRGGVLAPKSRRPEGTPLFRAAPRPAEPGPDEDEPAERGREEGGPDAAA